MKELLTEVGKKIAQLFKSGTTWIITILVVGFMFLSWLILASFTELSDGQYHYYKNISTSLKTISGKSFDDYDGKELRELSTEEQLVRKMNKKNRFRLKDLKPMFRH